MKTQDLIERFEKHISALSITEHLSEEEKEMILVSIFAGHFQEIDELREKWGCNNVEDIFYSEHRGNWIMTFKSGNDQEFDTKEEAIEWIKMESAQP